MLTRETAVLLAKYNNWADLVLFEALKSLPEGSVSQSRTSLFGSIIGTLNHNYQVDMIWRAHLEGLKHGFSTRRDLLYPEFSSLTEQQLRTNQWYIDWAKKQDSKSFSESLKFTFVSGKTAVMTKGGMFLHIITHKTYHRGWVSPTFFDHGVNPLEVDLCILLCESSEPLSIENAKETERVDRER